MKANAQDQAGAASLAKAIADHAKKVGDKTVDDIDFSQIDTADGAAIVKNVFGDNEEQIENQLGGLGGGGSSMFKSLLPMLAPILMGFLGKQAAGSAASAQGADAGGGGLGDIVGGLLGGGGEGGGGGLGDMLGGLLGGGGEGGGGGLGDLLGGLLGGGKR